LKYNNSLTLQKNIFNIDKKLKYKNMGISLALDYTHASFLKAAQM